MIVRKVPASNSKYKDLWQKAFFRIRFNKSMDRWRKEMNLFGTTVDKKDDINENAAVTLLNRATSLQALDENKFGGP